MPGEELLHIAKRVLLPGTFDYGDTWADKVKRVQAIAAVLKHYYELKIWRRK